MKRIMMLLFIFLGLSIVLVACGSGGGGGGGAAVSGTTPTSSLSKTVAFSAGGGYAAQPFAGAGGDLRMMILYRAQEMKGSGTITSIAFKFYDSLTPAVSCPHVTIKMSHSAQSGLDVTFANNINTGRGSQQTVLSDATVNIPAATTGAYYTIPLTTPYNYNGVDNLVVEIAHNSCTGDVHTATHNATGYDSVNQAFGSTTATIGATATWLPDTKFNLSGGENAITYTDDGTGASSNTYPFAFAQKMQLLYTAAEIHGSGIITSIGFPVATNPRGGTTFATSSTVTVKLGHTLVSALTGTFADNFNSGTPVTVANATTFTIPAGVPDGAYVWIPLPDGAFNYNGTDNLIVQIETSAITGGTLWIEDNSGTATRLPAAPGATTGTPDGARYFIKFRFAGGTVDVIMPGSGSFDYPFSGSFNNKVQRLYCASELGTKGTITKVAHRLTSDAFASDYSGFTVVLGHTTDTTLGSTTFSANMTGAQTVYSGTFSVTAGLKAGDWIEIPLTTPFAYDGTSNLVVQMSTLLGTASNNLGDHLDTVRYLSREKFANSNTTDAIGGTGSYLADLRLVIH